MGRSLSNGQGPLREDEIIMPTKAIPRGGEGSMSYDGVAFRMQDQLGIFDPRSGVGGSSIFWGLVSLNTLGDDEHNIRIELGSQAQSIVFSHIIDVTNGKDSPAKWVISNYTIDATGVDLSITLSEESFQHEDEDFTLELEYLWR